MSGPLEIGKQRRVLNVDASSAGVSSESFTVDGDAVEVAIWVEALSGDLDVVVYAVGDEDDRTGVVLRVPTISAATSNMVIKTSRAALQRIQVEATYSDAAEFTITVRSLAAVTDPEVYYEIVEEASGTVTFTGRSFDQTPATSDPVWQISQTVISGTTTTTSYAATGQFDQVWDDRNTLFPAVAFSNTHSLQFDGANDYVDIPHNANIDFDRLDPFTLSLWFKSTDSNSTYLEKMNGNTGYRFYSANNRLVLEFRATGTGDRIRVRTDATASELSDGFWHHFAATYDGSGNASGVALYIDGVAQTPDIQNDTLTGSPSNASNAAIAARTGGGDNFEGNMDEVSIWDDELDSTEVSELYNSGSPNDLSQHSNGSLVSWWTFNDITSFPTVPDNSSSNDGTMTNMVEGDIETEVP